MKKVNCLSLRTNRRYRLYFQFSVLKLSLIELLMTKKRSLTCFRCRKVKFTSSVRKEGDIVFVSSSNLKRTACFFWWKHFCLLLKAFDIWNASRTIIMIDVLYTDCLPWPLTPMSYINKVIRLELFASSREGFDICLDYDWRTKFDDLWPLCLTKTTN